MTNQSLRDRFRVPEHKVTVISRMAGKPEEGVKWESAGEGEFTLEPCAKPTRGTDVILHLREDSNRGRPLPELAP